MESGSGHVVDMTMANLVTDGRDATIIATGYMLTEAIKAVDLLEADGLNVAVLEMCTLKPLGEDAIVATAKRDRSDSDSRELQRHRWTGRRSGRGAPRTLANAAGQGGGRGRVQSIRPHHSRA